MEVQAGTFNPADFSWQGLTMTPAAAAPVMNERRETPETPVEPVDAEISLM